MKPPFISLATSQNLMPALGNRSEIGMNAEPMMPKAWSMPCICSVLTKASSVVIFIVPTPNCAPSEAAAMQAHEAGHSFFLTGVTLARNVCSVHLSAAQARARKRERPEQPQDLLEVRRVGFGEPQPGAVRRSAIGT